jgi:ribonuclease HII
MARKNIEISGHLQPNLQFEKDLWQSGYYRIAGLDEAGRGSWAGPVTAGAVVLPNDDPNLLNQLSCVRDSKKMSARQREYWVQVIKETSVAFSTGWATCDEITMIGILPATRLAMKRALEGLSITIHHLLIDAVRLQDVDIPQISLIKGDTRVLSISAASVLAKTERDHYMQLLEEEIPGYGFARHKGYGTAFHRCALETLGLCDQHRLSYAPIKSILFRQNNLE